MSEHSWYSPSSAHRWLKCPGSLDLEVQEDGASGYAAEGTAAHALAEQCWTLGTDAEHHLGEVVEGYEVTEEMAGAVQTYLDYCASLAKLGAARTEQRIKSEETPNFGGTLDFVVLGQNRGYVVDLKYGSGADVEVKDNPQLLSYAVLLREIWDVQEVEVAIVQPRKYHPEGPIRRTLISHSDMLEFRSKLAGVVHRNKDKPELHAGDHCRWCPAKRGCPRLYDLTIETARKEFSEADVETEDLSDLAKLVEMRSSLNAYLDSVAKYLHGQMDKGKHCEGYKLVNTYGNRRYKVPEEEVLKICRRNKVGKKQIYQSKLLSPAQLEKVVSREVVDQLTERPHKGTTVVPETDKRKAVENLTAKQEFNQ